MQKSFVRPPTSCAHRDGGTDAMRTSEILLRASERIKAIGWGQGNERGPSLCVMQSLSAAMGTYNFFQFTEAAQELREHLGLPPRIDPVFMDLVHWNDDPERTEEEVHQLLQGAAEKLRIQEEEKVLP